jgi:hypothetical protein
MTAVIIAESCFGNTAAVAEVIGEALSQANLFRVETFNATEAPSALPGDTDLLILAAPTHDYSLPRWRTRLRAQRRGGPHSHSTGIREWIAAVPPIPKLKVVTVDTAFRSGFMPSSAAKTAARLMAKAGFGDVRRGATFYVSNYSGPLEDGELIRARAWATTFAASLRSRGQSQPPANEPAGSRVGPATSRRVPQDPVSATGSREDLDVSDLLSRLR